MNCLLGLNDGFTQKGRCCRRRCKLRSKPSRCVFLPAGMRTMIWIYIETCRYDRYYRSIWSYYMIGIIYIYMDLYDHMQWLWYRTAHVGITEVKLSLHVLVEVKLSLHVLVDHFDWHRGQKRNGKYRGFAGPGHASRKDEQWLQNGIRHNCDLNEGIKKLYWSDIWIIFQIHKCYI